MNALMKLEQTKWEDYWTNFNFKSEQEKENVKKVTRETILSAIDMHKVVVYEVFGVYDQTIILVWAPESLESYFN